VSGANEQPVLIAMTVYNAAANLDAQLRSIAAQDHRDWTLIVSDDGSQDGSAEIAQRFAQKAGARRVIVRQGPQEGFAENFLSIVRDGWEPGLSLAFSDHDDVWFPDRLSRGLRALAGVGADTPALYCSRTIITDAALRPLRLSPPRPRAPSFRNALAQNIAAGNTILANPAAARLLHQAASRRPKIVSHDWWAYQIVTGAGGTILHDDAPTLLYRQHTANQLGANDSARARMRRIGMILSGVYRRWNDVNLAALTSASDLLTAENRDLVERFTAIRSGTRGLRCMTALRKLRLYRQTRASTAALYAAALFNRL
jgi:hypothetical protein